MEVLLGLVEPNQDVLVTTQLGTPRQVFNTMILEESTRLSAQHSRVLDGYSIDNNRRQMGQAEVIEALETGTD